MFSFEVYYEDLGTNPIEEGGNAAIMSFLSMWKETFKEIYPTLTFWKAQIHMIRSIHGLRGDLSQLGRLDNNEVQFLLFYFGIVFGVNFLVIFCILLASQDASQQCSQSLKWLVRIYFQVYAYFLGNVHALINVLRKCMIVRNKYSCTYQCIW